MRRSALRVASVVAGTSVAVVLAASGSAVKPPPVPPGPTPLTLTATLEDRVVLLTSPRGMWDYYGHVESSNNADGGGSYRALCRALEAPPPPGPHPAFTGQARTSTVIADRLTCTIVVLFENDNASLVMEGIVTKPTGSELFAASSDRALAVTGGTGSLTYQGSIGVAKPDGNHRITIAYW
jgi:hypothetical protein